MAERRMFTKKITDADVFTELPPTSQALYFHLCMGADDDGFSNQIRKAMFNAHADRNDFELLVNKRFIIPFESGVIVIKHWRMHNLIKSDRYRETEYIEEKAKIVLKQNGVYTENDTGTQLEPNWNQSGTKLEPQVRIGKERKGKVSTGKDRLDVCSEPQSVSEQEAQTASLILNDGSEWRPSVKDYEEWCRVYPNVDVFREFERMRQWCISNPTKRKTKRGIRRFVTNWLDSEQNKPRKQATSKIDAIDQWSANMERRANAEQGIF